jgi:hypothetical protein
VVPGNLGILGIVYVNAYLFFQQVIHANNRTMSCLKFFGRLTDKLIKNQEGVCTRQAAIGDQVATAVDSSEVPMIQKTASKR